ncbi:MAG: twin-arginine translocation pathway signal protein [Alphaproteobacteria bacterium HGW-Alphaproteobacteria-11]|nr:MAG: twin-arginine translocation pathway signal protein [Alphaproteobacteria bacterium HGW-Alphaproteobacteria-11]
MKRNTSQSITRRTALTLTAGAGSLLAAPSILRADAPHKRVLNLQSLNSGEKLNIVYWADDNYLPDAIKRVDWFMRDLRENKATPTDPRLLDLLHDIDANTRSKNPIYTMSGYRTERTNAWLDARGNGVDPGSFHMRGMAVDITQDFHDPEEVYRVAKKLGRGGAGFYPTKTPYAHVDVGPVDAWVYPAPGRPGRDEEYDRLQAEAETQTG